MKKKGQNTPKKEEIAEDWCFACKDGGLLLVCDYKQCLKSYHPDCVGKDDSFLGTGKHWTCDLHSCFICNKSSNFNCLCCPRAVCRRCIEDAEFVQLKGRKGFCRNCLKLALLVEENMDVDSDGGNVDFKDRETYEGLFREYWEIINEKEGLTLEDLQSADVRMKKGKNTKWSSDSDEYDEHEETEVTSDYDSDDEIEEKKPNHNRKRSKGKTSETKKTPMSNKKEFVGWGSRTLIEFLKSIGINVSQSLSQRDVTTLINDYIKEKKLFHPQKKRLVVCDTTLQTVLGRKTVNKHKIYDYLDCHFVENQQSSEEDEIGTDSEGNADSVITCKKQRKSGKDEIIPAKKKIGSNIHLSGYASIVPENISLVYLRRSLVQKLMEQPETFENKIIGSFVKVKSDPYDCFQKNSHQLVQVKGIKRSSGGENCKKILLQVSGMSKDISLSLLSDNDVTEEECQELKMCIKRGILRQPTVVELDHKAKILHEDITKHWIARELNLLQSRIDRANEKGWRRELFEFLERKQVLQTSKEQARLLEKIPSVIADEIELELISEDTKDEKQGDESSPKLFQMRDLKTPHHKWEGNRVASVAKEKEHHLLAFEGQANATLRSHSDQYGSCITGAKQSQLPYVEQVNVNTLQDSAVKSVKPNSDEDRDKKDDRSN